MLGSVFSALCFFVGGGTAIGLTFGANKALLAKAYEILASKLCQCLADKGGVFGAIKLQERPLKLLFMIVGGNVHRLHIQRIYACPEHDR